MSITPSLRRLAIALLSSCALSSAFVAAPVVFMTATVAQAQVSAEFESALEPYGEWVRHPRWGTVWIPYDRPPGWRPYTEGHWVYTDDWGWYWISEGDEEDWGWVAYHYGRWVLDRRMGWVWVPGDEWAPAWVDWRRGGDYVGWAPAPPDAVVYEYDDNPSWWIFVSPRYMFAPRMRAHVLPRQRTTVIIRQTVIVNRTVVVQQQAGQQRRRFAVNPGVAPNVVAAIARQPVQTFRVAPRVLPVTQGVQGAVTVQPQALGPRGRNAPPGARRPPPNPQVRVSVQPTNQTVAPAASVPKPQALPKNERGRLGDHPPRAAQGTQPAPLPSATPPAPAAPAQTVPQGRPQRAPQTQAPPPPAPGAARPQPPTQPAPPAPAKPVTPAPSTAKPPVPPAAARPVKPPPPTIQHAPPPAARPVTPPPAARPATPPPAAKPPAPPPAAAKPAPAPQKPAAAPPKPSERKPADKKPPPKPGEKKPEETK